MPTKKEWSRHLMCFFKSNLSMKAYTRENDLPYETFRRKVSNAKACENELTSCENETDFLPVQIKEPSCSSLEIKVNDVSVIINDNFDVMHLKKIVLILREC